MLAESPLELVAAIALGLGLAASTGFRVFLPLLVLGAAGRLGQLELAESFAWLSSTPALVALGVAAIAEIVAYYVPGVDHALDVIATPAALVAGPIAAGSVLVGLPPYLQWGLAIVGGGALAGATQASTSMLRLKSAAFTGGLANFLVATVELFGAAGLAILAILAPLLALGLVLVMLAVALYLARRIWRRLAGRPEHARS